VTDPDSAYPFVSRITILSRFIEYSAPRVFANPAVAQGNPLAAMTPEMDPLYLPHELSGVFVINQPAFDMEPHVEPVRRLEAVRLVLWLIPRPKPVQRNPFPRVIANQGRPKNEGPKIRRTAFHPLNSSFAQFNIFERVGISTISSLNFLFVDPFMNLDLNPVSTWFDER